MDVEAFIQKLKNLALPLNPTDLCSPEYLTVAFIARGRYGSIEAKANIVRAVLSGELPVAGNIDGTIAGLLVSHKGFQRWCANVDSSQELRGLASSHARSPGVRFRCASKLKNLRRRPGGGTSLDPGKE